MEREINLDILSNKIIIQHISKPIDVGENGYSCALFKDKQNSDFDENDEYELSLGVFDFDEESRIKCTQENIETMVKNIITFMETKLKAKKINYHVKLEGNPIVTLNTEAINIILINLIENAVDAFPAASEDNLIQISIFSTEDSLQFLIEDNGVGIVEEGLPYIFDPFYTTKEEGHGTGLGLYLVYNEVKKYNGDISVESQLGIGTKFFISIHF